MFEDNQSAIAMTKILEFHGQAKQIDIKFHYVREQVTARAVELKHCQSEDVITDMLTNGLIKIQFNTLRKMIEIIDISYCD